MIKLQKNNKTLSGRLLDEVIMLDMDKGKYLYLNSVATRIWDLLENPVSMDEICSKLMEEYDVDPKRCRSDVNEIVKKMIQSGMVVQYD
jgi:hypothetical protein